MALKVVNGKLMTDKSMYNMKVVTSETCKACKTQCERGIRYMDKMSKEGAIGKGVPCHLTKGKNYR